jgi:hypothetical protein
MSTSGSISAPGFNEDAGTKFSPFIDVNTKPDANGICKTYVVFGNNATMEPAELISIDGVSFNCMSQFWSDRAIEFVAADSMIALLQTTKASPKGNEIVQIEAIPKGSTSPRTYHVPLKYQYWRKLNAKLQAKLGNTQQKFKCWRGPKGGYHI